MPELAQVGEAAAVAGACVTAEVDRARDEAALSSMAWALAELAGETASAAMHHERLAPGHASIVRRWLEQLTLTGWIDPNTGRWLRRPPTQEAVGEAWRLALDLAPASGSGGALTRFFSSCAHVLPEILTGEVQVQALLFADDDIAEEIYQNNEASRYTNAVAAAAVRQHCLTLLGHTRTPVVLEIGGGIGGTTDIVLDALTDLPLRFHFTDVGPWFLTRAEERYAGRSGLTTGLLDINASQEYQRARLGSLAGELDMVLAANVLHNAGDVVECLRRLASWCRAGAQLVMIETGTEHLPLLMSMRFLMSPPPASQGQGVGSERSAQGRILLSSDQWNQALAEAGWSVHDLLPAMDSTHPAARYDQRVWLAACEGGPS